MSKNYLWSLAITVMLCNSSFAQKNPKLNDNEAYQRTLEFDKGTSKTSGIKRFTESYGLSNDNTFNSKQKNVDKITGMTHEKYEQFYKGLKVVFGTLIVHGKSGNVESINGELYNIENLNLNPEISAQKGFDMAVAYKKAQKYLWEDKESADALNYKKPEGDLVIFPIVNKGEVKLAYKYDIYSVLPLSRDEVYVDAHNGQILYANPIIKHAKSTISSPEMDEKRVKAAEVILLGEAKDEVTSIVSAPLMSSTAATRYSGTKTIQTDLSGANYILSEATRTTNGITSNGARTYNSNNTNTYPTTDFTNASTSWSTGNYSSASTTRDNAALDAHWGAEMVFDWWSTVFNRNSYDNNGAKILSWVHFNKTNNGATGFDNAFWNGVCMTYGDGNTTFTGPLTSIDVCGHEIGHAVCSYTSDLAYQNHSGAMNEGLSDIWGTCIEWWARNGNFNMPADGASPGTQTCWKIGEDITTSGLRSMSWPRSKGNPDTFKGTSWTSTVDDGGTCVPQGDSTLPGYNDACGVHNNSGVLNHWFYLLTIGKTNWTNNATPSRTTTTTGIGMQKSSQITYLAERDYLTPNATYFDMRNATITVAKNLYGCGSPEHIAVMNAWYAVNLGSSYNSLDVKLKSVTGDMNYSCGVAHSANFILANDNATDGTSANTTLAYSVDGVASTPVTWIGGNLTNCANPNQTYTVNFGALSRGTHTLTVTATTTGDTDTTNNSKTISFIVNDAGTVGTTNSFTTATDVLVSIDSNGTTNTLWQRSTAAKTPILPNSQSDKNGMITKTSGNYPDNTQSYLVSQCYNLSNYTATTVSFDMAFDLESNWDILYFEYSIDNGATWNVLGTMADPNWYNSSRLPDGTDCFNCIGKQWTGLYATAPTGGNGMNGNRRNYSHSLASLGKPANAIFRFNFKSDEGSNNTGVIIDNFVVSGTLGTNSNSFEQFGVYPNPSNGKFNLVLSTSEKVKVDVYDLRGRLVFDNQYEAKGAIFNQEVDLSKLSNGVYILNVESNGKKEARRIIIE